MGSNKGKLTSGRFVNNGDKLNANKAALKQIEIVKKGKCNPCTLWAGTPQYLIPKYPKLSSTIQTLLGSLPTLWIPYANRGILVIGAPGSGKTFSVIDRLIESAFKQGIPVLLYDKKGDQMKQHSATATRYGYNVNIFAPGEKYSGTINLLDFMESAQDATMAGEIAQTIISNAPGAKNSKGDSFFQKNGETLAKGLLQLAKNSKYPDIGMVYAIARLPDFIKRLHYAVYREDEQKLDSWIASTFSTFLASKDAEKTVAGIKATAETTFTSFIQKDLLRSFIGKSTIPIYQNRKQLIVFKLDDRRRSVLTPLIAACIHLVITNNLADKRTSPFLVSLDEFPSLYLEKITNYVNEYRSNGGIFTIGIQSLTQLEEAYGDKLSRSIAAGLSTHFLFNPGDIRTAEDYSKKFGEEEILIKSRSKGRSMGQHGSRSINISESLQKKPLLPTDQILRFPQGTCVMTSPAYGNKQEALFPYKLRINIPKKDIKRASESESLWENSIEKQISNRIQKEMDRQGNSGDTDWITNQLNLRIEEAFRLLPLPDEEQQTTSNNNTTGKGNLIDELRAQNKTMLEKQD